tara:strand:+ start:19928 stop:20116 length:189 start_codon:yes stop_codon:yes gene_type:complete
VTPEQLRCAVLAPVPGNSARATGDLRRYAAAHAQAYGESVYVLTLILHMLEAFMAGHRGVEK